MGKKEFNKQELEKIGEYKTYDTLTQALEGMRGISIPPEPRFAYPISPKENLKLLLNKKIPYWMPKCGFFFSDVQNFRPREVPDNCVTHLVFDGGVRMEYPSCTQRSSWFDLDWVFVPEAGGATVKPGKAKLEDITCWEEYLTMPDLNEINWTSCQNTNKEYLNTDKFNELCILSGPWERLMSLLDVENAAIALIEEEQKEGVHRFLNDYCNLMDDFIGRMSQHVSLDGVLMHDDWGHQNGPFFSLDTAREMLLPYLSRIVESCHKRGLFYEQHCCGKNEMLVDVFLEAKVDLWCPQAINDIPFLLEKCKNKDLVIGVPVPILPKDLTLEEIRSFAKEWVEKHKHYRAANVFLAPNPDLAAALYEFSRIAFL